MKKISNSVMIAGVMIVMCGILRVANAEDLTGTWEGRVTCEGVGFNGEVVRTQGDVLKAAISQYPDPDGQAPDQPILCLALEEYGNLTSVSHTGRMIMSSRHQGNGELILVRFGVLVGVTPILDTPSEVGRGSYSTGTKDTLDATTVRIVTNQDTGVLFSVGNCKWRFDRLDTVDPGLICHQ